MAGIIIKSLEEISIMRESGRIVARAHEAMREALRPGITTGELDRIAETVIRDHGAVPAFLNYPKPNSPNYPATINASINHELIHGIPSPKRFIKEGDLVSLDVGCIYKGYVADAARSWGVGQVTPAIERLMKVTEESFFAGLKYVRVGCETRDIARAVQTYIETHGYAVVREYTGHGVGRSMHEDPEIPNWWPNQSRNRFFRSFKLEAGMTFAIEPMVVAGRSETKELADKWTVVSRDGSLCAHYENTVAVTDGDPIILTAL